MTELTEAEKALLFEAGAIIRGDAMREGATFGEADAAAYNAVLRPVARIIDARLAPIRALVTEFGGEWELDENDMPWIELGRLRAALDAASAPVNAQQDHDGAEGRGEGENPSDARPALEEPR